MDKKYIVELTQEERDELTKIVKTNHYSRELP